MAVSDPATVAALTEWNNIKQQQAALQVRERELRTYLLASCFDPEFIKGSRTLPLWQGWRLKAVRPWKYKLTDDNGQTRTVLSRFTPEMANNLVRWKPDLSVSTFNGLMSDYQALFVDALTITPESPQLELLAPNQPEQPTLY